MPSAITIDSQDVLLAIDLQADFMPGGALAVADGDAIVPHINALARQIRACGRHARLAPGGARLLRLGAPARSRSR